jgi:hypothetical protein
MNIFKLAERILTEQGSLELAYELGMLPRNSSKCAYCGCSATLENKLRHGVKTILRCNIKKCRKRSSILKKHYF